MRCRFNFLACATVVSWASLAMTAEKPRVDQIMEKVAANQDRAHDMRREFVYRQKVLIRFTRGNGRLAREELRELQVTPTPEQTEKTLVRFLGKYEKNGKLLEFADPGFRHKELDLDGEIISEFAEEFTNDKKSRDGIAKDFFPLTVRVLLGTDVQRLGFKVAYEKFGENIWFPVSYGGKFKLKALFLYKRNIAIALNNSNFQRTAVSTWLVFNDLLEINQPLKLPEMPPRVLRAEVP